MAIQRYSNVSLSVVRQRVYNHYRNNRAAALRNVDLSRAIQLAARARARSRKTTVSINTLFVYYHRRLPFITNSYNLTEVRCQKESLLEEPGPVLWLSRRGDVSRKRIPIGRRGG